MTQEKVMQTIRNHGLCCMALTDSGLIGLTDSAGSVYDVIIWDGRRVIEDENTSMSLADWLGY